MQRQTQSGDADVSLKRAETNIHQKVTRSTFHTFPFDCDWCFCLKARQESKCLIFFRMILIKYNSKSNSQKLKNRRIVCSKLQVLTKRSPAVLEMQLNSNVECIMPNYISN